MEQLLIMTLTVMKYLYDKNDARSSIILKEEPKLRSTPTAIIKASEDEGRYAQDADESFSNDNNS